MTKKREAPTVWKKSDPPIWCVVELYGDGTWRPNRTLGTFTKRQQAQEVARWRRERAAESRKATAKMFRKLGGGLKLPKQKYKCRVERCEIVPASGRLSKDDRDFSPMPIGPFSDT